MKHPELREGEIFLGYFERSLVFNDGGVNIINFRTKRVGEIVINEFGGRPVIDEDGKVFRVGEDFPVFVHRSEIEESPMDIDWFFELNPMIAALNGIV